VTLAARLIAHREPLRVEGVGLPAPAEEEVVVDLAFGGINPVDRYAIEGRVAPDGPLPRTLGAEASGYCDGKPVLVHGAGLGSRRDGVWAQRAVAPVSAVIALPGGVDMRAAGAMGIAGLTAWNVVHLAGVGAGDRVLVLGAAGGTGLPIVSLASSLRATVWGQTRHEAKAAVLRAQGAAHVVVTNADGLAGTVREFQPTVVIDPLGDGFTPAALSAMAVGGRYVLFGTSAGATATLQLQQLYRSALHLLGYGGLQLTDEQRRAGLTGALAAMADGRLRIVVGRTFPLAEVNAAIEASCDRSVTGKVMLDLGGRPA
jgi:NADPH2:quinone reductase